MKYNILIILVISLFINELIAAPCPDGTETDTGALQHDNIINCVKCRANYYYNGGNARGAANGGQNFVPGADNATGQCVLCQVNKAGGVATRAQDANLATQCSLQCPIGTALANGNTVFVQQVSECTHCKPNHYFNGGSVQGAARGGDNFTAGALDATGQCVPCQVNRDDSPNTRGQDAALATQCSLQCPTGTVLANSNASFLLSFTECTNCATNHYYKPSAPGVAFQAGTSQCAVCPANRDNGPSTQGDLATIVTQCNVACPVGTAISSGESNYVNASTECVNCKPNFYYNGPAVFVAGTTSCTACPQTGMKDVAVAVANLGDKSNISVQCNVECPIGSANANGDKFWTNLITDCTNCAADYYFSGNFTPGTSQCIKCPASIATPKTAAGNNASLATQCNPQCPTGTVLDDGTKNTYVAQLSECTKCAANYYTSKTTGFAVGTDTCTECPKKLASGAAAKLFAEANQKVQCASSTFAKFLQISLLFISFYLL